MTTKTETKLERLWRQWDAGEIEKYEFYASTMGYTVTQIYEVTGIDPWVILDRRRYLRQLSKMKGD
jgi:hypothetical protein